MILMALNLVVLKAKKNKKQKKDLKAPAAISLSRNPEGSFM